ncbi:MAG: AAA family ATPase [Cyanobacteria bacterium REEB67]|nr:AAA family ATPase [Cyanobacteria bacterium REEB67]
MKIQKLDLKKFGPFTDKCLDFSAGSADTHGLHVVFGPNESGKSSSLRALRQLLYGIPPRSADDFIHAAKDMRIGGELHHSDGSALAIVRRKGKSQALRDRADKDTLDESVLHKYLGGLSQGHFESMFGIDHAGLIAGGQALFNGKGELGQILFSAGAGVGDINRITDNLAASEDALFRPLGQTQTINALLLQLKEAQTRLKKSEVSAGEWEVLDQSLTKSRAKKADIEQEISQKVQAKGKLERTKAALPLVAERLGLEKVLTALKTAQTILLPENFGDRSRELRLELKRGENEQDSLKRALTALDAELEPMQIPTALIDRAVVIEDLQQKLGSHLKAMSDRSTNVVVGLTEHENNMRAALKNLGHPPDLDLCENLRITVAQKTLIRELAASKAAVEGKCEAARGRLELLNKNIATTEAELARLSDVAQPERLVKAIKRIEQKGAIEGQLKTAKMRCEAAVEQLSLSVKKLMISSSPLLADIAAARDWDKLESLAIPGAETIERFASDMDKYCRHFEQLQETGRALDDELQKVVQQLEQLRLEMDTPTEEDLAAARASREQGWQLVKGVWLSPPGSLADSLAAQAADYLVSTGTAGDADSEAVLAEAFETSVSKADNISDRLRRESTQIAKRASLMAEQTKLAQKRNEIGERLLKGENAQKALEESWVETWSRIAIKPLPPKEMRVWATNYNDALKQIKTVRETQVALQDIDGQVAESKAELLALLTELDGGDGSTKIAPAESLAALLERCQQIVAEVAAVRSERLTLGRDLEKLKFEQGKVEQDHSQALSALEAWKSEWAVAVIPLGQNGPVLPSQANAIIETLETLFANQTQAQQFANRLNGIDRDAANFKARVKEIVTLVAADLIDFPPEQAATELNARLSKARTNKERLELLTRQHEEKTAALLDWQSKMQECKNELDLMCTQASVSDYEALPQAADGSKRLRETQSAFSQNEKALLALSGGVALEPFVADVEAVDADNILPTIAQLQEEIDALSKTRGEYDEAIGRDKNELTRIDGGGMAAEAAEDIQTLMAKIASASEQYARVHIARALMKQCVARYREKNQSPVLKRASEVFESLTLGSFVGLREDYSDKGESILVGVRPDSTLVGLGAMSEGTCDQAYLALRLASLELYLQNHEPLPFIVDDILVNFDDGRSLAALSILVELSRRTQVIFFTHHAHLIDLATAKLAEDVLFVHDLTKGPERSLAGLLPGQ